MAAELSFDSIGRVRSRLERRELSAEELVEALLDRCQKHSRLNAFITVCSETALQQARRADERIRNREPVGRLHGIPFTVKDIVATAGHRTTSGSKIDAERVTDENAMAWQRLEDEGAILLAKTNLHELAFGVTNVNPHFGSAHNPWDPERVSGGSSGGSAVALAAGIGFGSIGSDTGGSIRIPSSLCGVVGLKPTYGRVSRHGVTPLSWSLDHVGPMARTVRDVAVLYEVMSGHDGRDPQSSRHPLDNVSDGLEPLPGGLRVGVERSYFFDNVASDVLEVVEAALEQLEALGLEPVEVDLPGIELHTAARNTIAFAEASTFHESSIRGRPEDIGEDVRELLRLGLTISASDYLRALEARRVVVEGFLRTFRTIDVLASPATMSAAPVIGEKNLANGEDYRSGLIRAPGPFNTTGFPAISVPCGFTRSGLPVGLQLAAGPWKEALLLQVAHAYERSQPWHDRHPELDRAPAPNDIVRRRR